MNLFAHAIIGFILSQLFFSPTEYLMIGLMIVAAIILDLDHIHHLRRAFKTTRFGYQSRTRFHELYGLTIGLIFFLVLSVFTSFAIPLMIAFVSHFFLDWLTRPTRPFYPYSEKVLHFNIYPKSLRGLVIADSIVTAILLIISIILIL